MPFTWLIESYETLPSTQDKLKEKLNATPDLAEGFVIKTNNQTHGYGRYGRSWEGGEYNLYLSFIIRPQQDPITTSQIALITGLAITKAIKQYVDTDIILKWPNDVLIDNKKCAGILIESVHTDNNKNPVLVVGVGVNIKNCPFENSTFLNEYTNTAISIDAFQKLFFDIFGVYYSEWKNQGFKPFQDKFIRQTYAKNTQIGVKIGSQKITGKFKNIDSNGNLELLCDETLKLRKITSGEVFLM